MTKYKAGILQNESDDSTKKWEIACQKTYLDYEVISILDADWLDKVKASGVDFFLLRPSGNSESFKKIYDERVYILSKVLGYKIFPSYEEVFVYENKKLLAEYLKANELPHPQTKVFYHKKQALTFAETTPLPIVAKTSIGASGSGVRILKTKNEVEGYVKKAFSSKGIKRSFGPNRAVGTPKKWFKKAVNSPSFFIERIKRYISVYKATERGFAILQEYIPHEYEWRVVKIGESYFAHKKIKFKEKASGSKGIEYVNPPLSILDFTKSVCEKMDFQFMAIDLFEDGNGGFLINELQTIFGHVQDYILAIDNQPGRYLFISNQWVFEPGDFNTNESYDLRLQVAIELFEKSKC